MQFAEDELNIGLDMIPESSGREYLKAPIDFIMDFAGLIQADKATWALEATIVFTATVVTGVMAALSGLVWYDAYTNPAIWTLFNKYLFILRDLVLSKLPKGMTSWLP